MSKRKLYRPDEIRAGKTIHIVVRTSGAIINHYGVASYLVAGKSEPQPDPSMVHPYRMHPDIAQYALQQTDLWKTRKAAQAESDRRQAIEMRRMSGGAHE